MGGAGTSVIWRSGWRSVGLSVAAAVLFLLISIASWAGVAEAAPAFESSGSVEQVYATGVPAGAAVTLRDGSGNVVASKSADELGAVLFREVEPGSGYRLEVGGDESE